MPANIGVENVNIKVRSESPFSSEPAVAYVEVNGRPVARVIGEVVLQKGMDGGMYHVVKLKGEPCVT